jgi:hypothetical protein
MLPSINKIVTTPKERNMNVLANPYFTGAQIASTVMIESIKTLYRISISINDFLNDHIEEMKRAENPTVSRTGRVLEMAKYGFGIGYITPVVVISVGQLLLGNPLAAGGTLASAAILSNPIAMTCAAVGAIYYGWNALDDQEKEEMLEKLSDGLKIGIEMIKSVIRFVIEKSKELWNSENLSEIKNSISQAAEVFGKKLGDVTHKISDKVTDGLITIKTKTVEAMDKTADIASETYVVVKEKTGQAADLAVDVYTSVKEHGEKVGECIKSKKSKNVAEVKQDSLEGNENHFE